MRWSSTWLVSSAMTAVAACGGSEAGVDAAPDDAPIDGVAIDGVPVDAPVDVPEIDACTTRILFAGGTDPTAQGWTVTRSGTAEVSATDAMTTQLRTQTVGTAGAQLLLNLPGAVTPGAPFSIEVTLQVIAVTPHNAFDAAVAIMGSFTPPSGTSAERSQMIYVDSGGVGWADDTARFNVAAIDGAFHTYRLAVDAGATATVFRDDQLLLTRAGFVTNGTLAIGDQTNDPNVESTILLRSVSLLCP